MERQLQIHTKDINLLRSELGHVVEHFRGLGFDRCEVFFGFAWNTERGDLAMKTIDIALLDVITEISRSEGAGLGSLGNDDVCLCFDGCPVEVQFCHHGGIHVRYAEPNDIAHHFQNRLRAAGLDVQEFEREDGTSELRPVTRKPA